MGHSNIKTGENERKFIAQVLIQHHRAVQPHTAISRLARAVQPQIPRTDHYCAWKKKPTKAEHSSLADFEI